MVWFAMGGCPALVGKKLEFLKRKGNQEIVKYFENELEKDYFLFQNWINMKESTAKDKLGKNWQEWNYYKAACMER